MLEKIAKIVNLRYDEADPIVMKILERIRAKVPASISEDDEQFTGAVEKAEQEVNGEGQMAIVALVKQLTAPPQEKMLKIKSSPKGVRVKIAATNGVRYSFGPIWNESVKKAKGIAVAEVNRAKLNHQAVMVGISKPEQLEVEALCAAIAKTF